MTFFSLLNLPQKNKNTVHIFNVAFSRDETGSSCPDDEASDAVIKIL